MTEALVPILRSIRQKGFYTQPRFHASIAWALLSPAVQGSQTEGPSSTKATDAMTLHLETPVSPESLDAGTPSQAGNHPQSFSRIERLPPHVISELKSEFGAALLDRAVGTFHVDTICVRIGKDVSRWKLGGQ